MHRYVAFPELNRIAHGLAVSRAVPGKGSIQLGADGKAFLALNQLPELLIGAVIICELHSGALFRLAAYNL